MKRLAHFLIFLSIVSLKITGLTHVDLSDPDLYGRYLRKRPLYVHQNTSCHLPI